MALLSRLEQITAKRNQEASLCSGPLQTAKAHGRSLPQAAKRAAKNCADERSVWSWLDVHAATEGVRGFCIMMAKPSRLQTTWYNAAC